MKIDVSSRDLSHRYTTQLLLQRMLSPLCGLDLGIGFFMRGRLERRFMTAGAQLTGVHLLINQPKPDHDPYHIGGSGIFIEEVLIRALGETVERYAQFVSGVSNRYDITLASYDEIAARGERVIMPEKLSFFTPEQCKQPGFPFHSFSRDMPMGWVKAPSLLDDSTLWVPAQLLLLGYIPQHQDGERRLLASVTTGTAAHTSADLALRNALLELIQLDSVMGHWYSSARAQRIVLDNRTEDIERLIIGQFDRCSPLPKFYWLPNPDLIGMSIACIIEEDAGQIPATAVGLGSDLKLVDAMYKALLEAVGVAQLAKLTLFYDALEASITENEINPSRFEDLNRNVAFYALPEHSAYLHTKFDDRFTVQASALPPDSSLDTKEELHLLVEAFRTTKKDLVYLDLTTLDIKDLGFIAVRVWSPDTISLSLPGFPPASHPRFKAYGGVSHENPHPYP